MEERGFSLLELLATMAIMSVMLGIASYNYLTFVNPLDDAAMATKGFLDQVRARAISTTSAFRVFKTGTTSLEAKLSVSCDDPDTAFVADTPRQRLILDAPITFGNDVWDLCFSSRGFAISTGNVQIPLTNLRTSSRDSTRRQQWIEVFLGGAVEIRRS